MDVVPSIGKVGVTLAIFAVRLWLMTVLNVVNETMTYRVLVTVIVAVAEEGVMRSAIVCYFPMEVVLESL